MSHQNPAQANIIAARQNTNAAYKGIADALLKGDQQDRQLALQLVNFIKTMPPLKTRHEQTVENLRTPERVASGGVEKGKDQGNSRPDKDRAR